MFLLGTVINWFRKFKYETVAVRYTIMSWVKADKEVANEKITYILQENGFGKRKVKIYDYGYCKIYKSYRTFDVYQHEIIPWLNGVNVGTISAVAPKPTPSKPKIDKKKGNVVYLKKDD